MRNRLILLMVVAALFAASANAADAPANIFKEPPPGSVPTILAPISFENIFAGIPAICDTIRARVAIPFGVMIATGGFAHAIWKAQGELKAMMYAGVILCIVIFGMFRSDHFAQWIRVFGKEEVANRIYAASGTHPEETMSRLILVSYAIRGDESARAVDVAMDDGVRANVYRNLRLQPEGKRLALERTVNQMRLDVINARRRDMETGGKGVQFAKAKADFNAFLINSNLTTPPIESKSGSSIIPDADEIADRLKSFLLWYASFAGIWIGVFFLYCAAFVMAVMVALCAFFQFIASAFMPIFFGCIMLEPVRDMGVKFFKEQFTLALWPAAWAIGSIGTGVFLNWVLGIALGDSASSSMVADLSHHNFETALNIVYDKATYGGELKLGTAWMVALSAMLTGLWTILVAFRAPPLISSVLGTSGNFLSGAAMSQFVGSLGAKAAGNAGSAAKSAASSAGGAAAGAVNSLPGAGKLATATAGMSAGGAAAVAMAGPAGLVVAGAMALAGKVKGKGDGGDAKSDDNARNSHLNAGAAHNAPPSVGGGGKSAPPPNPIPMPKRGAP